MLTDSQIYAALNLTSGIGIARCRKLLKHFGSLQDIPGHSAEDYLQVKGIPNALAQTLADHAAFYERLEKEQALADRLGVRILTPADAEFPQQFLAIDETPLAIYLRGTLANLGRSVSIVGSRVLSAYGERMTVHLAKQAAECGYTVISGLAYGADVAAHTQAVRQHRPSIGILGSGLTKITPSGNEQVALEMLEYGGAILSELPLKVNANHSTFVRRNRLIAALGDAVIVTEGKIDSGSLITAEYARAFGKPCFAVPGQADNANSSDCNWLIKNHRSELVESFSDVWNVLHPGKPMPEKEDQAEPLNLSASQQQIIDHLQKRAANTEELIVALHPDMNNFFGDLTYLEFMGLVQLDSDRKYYPSKIRK